jgi:hypothetical protein
MRRAAGKALTRSCERGETPLERYCTWIEDGWTAQRIADHLAELAGVPINRQPVRMWLIDQYGQEAVDDAIRAATPIRAMHHVEDAHDAIANADPDPATGEVTKAKELAKVKLQMAAFDAPERYGQAKAGVTVNLNVGQLHLSALQARKLAVGTIATAITATDVTDDAPLLTDGEKPPIVDVPITPTP